MHITTKAIWQENNNNVEKSIISAIRGGYYETRKAILSFSALNNIKTKINTV